MYAWSQIQIAHLNEITAQILAHQYNRISMDKEIAKMVN